MSAVISQMAKLPSWISYMKVRGSWASVGSAISPNITSPWRYVYNPASGTYSTVTYKFPKNFRPERTNSWEAGLTTRFFNNALTLDVTLYQSNTKNQTFLRPITGGQGFTSEYVQTGNVRTAVSSCHWATTTHGATSHGAAASLTVPTATRSSSCSTTRTKSSTRAV